MSLNNLDSNSIIDHLEEETNIFEQQDFSEDVLPFLLQADDIIAKLESRVKELENDLSTIHHKYEHDRNEWLIGLSQKDQYITYLSGKLQKSEFNSKETILLLSDLNDGNTILDEQVKSTLNLCLNYLRQNETQRQSITVTDIDNDDLEEGELERRQTAVLEWRRNDNHKSCDNTMIDDNFIMNNRFSSSSFSSSATDKISFSDSQINNSQPTTLFDEDHSNFCTNCKQLLSQLDIQVEKQAYLKRDLNSLASVLSTEENIRAMVEQDKKAIEEDVVDVTTSLFEILNEILMEEVTNKENVLQMNRETNGKLGFILDTWDFREIRLKQIKDFLIELDSIVSQSTHASCTISHRYSLQPSSITTTTITTTDTNTNTNTNINTRLTNRTSISHPRVSMDQAIHHDNPTIRIDGFILSEFQEHLKILNTTTNPLPMSPFFKRVLIEDIEPCLFFQGWWKSAWFKKRLLDAISKGQCEIQEWHHQQHHHDTHSNYTTTTTSSSSNMSNISPATSHISSVSSYHYHFNTLAVPKTKCACCNKLRICEFRMRLPVIKSSIKKSSVEQQSWLPIDRFCRDKLVAVCEYYNFMSHLKLFLTSTPLLNMFKQVMLYRRKMSLAKIGSIELFVEEAKINHRLSSSSNASLSKRQRQQRRQNRESIVLVDYPGFGDGSSSSDTASVVSIRSELQALDGHQVAIVH